MAKPGRKATFTERQQVFLRPTTLEQIRDAAEKQGMSTSHFIRIACERLIAEQEGARSGH